MIEIIKGEIGSGKTTYITARLIDAMCDRKRLRNMRRAIATKNIERSANGRPRLSVPVVPCFANYDVTLKKYRMSPKTAYRINPFMIGFANEYCDTHYLPEYSVVGITEAQKYFDSHRWKDFPSWQSRYYEAHRHNSMDFYLDVQKYGLINDNIRSISQFVDIVGDMEVVKDDDGVPVKFVWNLRRFRNSSLLDRFVASGEQDTKCFTTEKYTAKFNVWECFNSKLCKVKFDEGHEQDDYSLFDACEDEMPAGYIVTKTVAVKPAKEKREVIIG